MRVDWDCTHGNDLHQRYVRFFVNEYVHATQHVLNHFDELHEVVVKSFAARVTDILCRDCMNILHTRHTVAAMDMSACGCRGHVVTQRPGPTHTHHHQNPLPSKL